MNRCSSSCSGLNYRYTMVNFIDGNKNWRRYPPITPLICHHHSCDQEIIAWCVCSSDTWTAGTDTFATAIFFSAVRCGSRFFFYLRVPSGAACSQVRVGCWHEGNPVKRSSAFTLWPLRGHAVTPMASDHCDPWAKSHNPPRPVANFTWNPTPTLSSWHFLVPQQMYPDC